MRKLTLPLLALLFLLPAGCGAKPRDLIVGKWQEAEDPEFIIDYRSDGSVDMSYKGKVKMSGTYKFLKDDIIDVDVQSPEKPGLKQQWQMKIKIVKDEMTTNDLGRDKAIKRFTRMKG